MTSFSLLSIRMRVGAVIEAAEFEGRKSGHSHHQKTIIRKPVYNHKPFLRKELNPHTEVCHGRFGG